MECSVIILPGKALALEQSLLKELDNFGTAILFPRFACGIMVAVTSQNASVIRIKYDAHMKQERSNGFKILPLWIMILTNSYKGKKKKKNPKMHLTFNQIILNYLHFVK